MPCPCCGGRMIIIETFERGCSPRYRPTAPPRNQDRHLMTAPQARKLLVAFAGSRPATAALAQISSHRRQSPANLTAFDADPPLISRSRFTVAPTRSIALALRSPPHPRRSNPHSARAHRPRLPHRGFLPWRFSDAGPRARGAASWGRHPKTFTNSRRPSAKSGQVRFTPTADIAWHAPQVRDVPKD